jgi:hypothetical protein
MAAELEREPATGLPPAGGVNERSAGGRDGQPQRSSSWHQISNMKRQPLVVMMRH